MVDRIVFSLHALLSDPKFYESIVKFNRERKSPMSVVCLSEFANNNDTDDPIPARVAAIGDSLKLTKPDEIIFAGSVDKKLDKLVDLTPFVFFETDEDFIEIAKSKNITSIRVEERNEFYSYLVGNYNEAVQGILERHKQKTTSETSTQSQPSEATPPSLS